jgi:hypothetical protein
VNTLSLCLPESLHRHARSLAKHEGISVTQLISSALDEKLAALETFDYIRARATRGSLDKFRAIMAKLPSVSPSATDVLEED